MAERLVVIGGDAAGMSAASQARRRRNDLEIVALEKGRWVSYSACGLPYLVGGDVDDIEDLVVRTPQEFRDKQRIDVRMRQEAKAINLDTRTIEVFDHEHRRSYALGFDILHIAMGAVPMRPPLPGIDGPTIHGVQTLEDGAHLLEHAENMPTTCKVVVVGAGYIGLEMAEAFVKRGADVTVLTATPQPMGTLDEDMGQLIAEEMRRHGIDLRTETEVQAFEDDAVHTADDTHPADIIVLGMGVNPNSGLAADAGVATGHRGAITTDQRQRTNVDGVWAAGDCCDSLHRVSNLRRHVALGTVANKQGRVAGINIGGGYATFPGVIGTAVSKLCAIEVARTGLTEREADEAGFEFVSATVESTTRAGYFPGAKPITVKVLAEKRSGRLLGAQIVGEEGAAKRIDVFATALTARLTVEEMTSLDLSYAPPFSPVWDPVLVAARAAADRLAVSQS